MNHNPLFSIIIPTFNRAANLLVALKSLENQTFDDFEVIVCDDGSTDNTKDIIDAFSINLTLIYIWNENSGGPAKPRNIGIARARGEWICFLDSDDYWYPKKLEATLPFLNDSDLIYHNLEVIGKDDPVTQKQIICRKISNENAYMDLLLKWNGIANSSVVIRKKILDKVGLFDENNALVGVEDFDMWLRIAKISNRFTLIPQVLGCYYLSDKSVSRIIHQSIERDFTLLKKYKNELTEKQFLNVNAVVNILAGIRYLINNDSKLANKYFYLALLNKSRFIDKIKSLTFILLGKQTFRFLKIYRSLQNMIIE